MSIFGDYLWAEMRLPSKYKLVVIDGNSPPKAVHEDGWTKWKNGRPKQYTRATNELRVGRDWLHATFPATYTERRLTGQDNTEIHPLDISMRQWVLAQSSRPSAEQAWGRIETLKSDRAMEPENERLYA